MLEEVMCAGNRRDSLKAFDKLLQKVTAPGVGGNMLTWIELLTGNRVDTNESFYF